MATATGHYIGTGGGCYRFQQSNNQSALHRGVDGGQDIWKDVDSRNRPDSASREHQEDEGLAAGQARTWAVFATKKHDIMIDGPTNLARYHDRQSPSRRFLF